MTIELIDGKAGKPHISGADLGDFKAGFIGQAGYVLKTGEMLAASQASANEVTIGTGSAIMPTSGRHVRVTEPEKATIESGTQGQKRNDLIVLRTSTSADSSTVESASIVVIKGTATADTPADPDTQEGDLPLYRVSLDGVSAAEPLALFSVLTPYAEFRDSISHSRGVLVPGGCCYDRAGGMVVVHIYNCSAYKGSTRTLGTLPVGFRPAKAIEGSTDIGAIGYVTSIKASQFVLVHLDGRVTIGKIGDENREVSGQVMFAV